MGELEQDTGQALIDQVDAVLAPNWICALISRGAHGCRIQLQRRSDEEYALPGGLRCVQAGTFGEAVEQARLLTHGVGENWAEEDTDG